MKYLLLFSFLALSPVAFGFFPVADTGRLLREEKLELSAHTHFVFSPSGLIFNGMAHFDMPFLEQKSLNIKYILGFGWSGLTLGSFIKWIPFPDYMYQPAVGVAGGLVYQASDVRAHALSLTLRPLISKNVLTVVGEFTPYLAFPLSMRVNQKLDVDFPIRVSFGLRGELFFIHFRRMDINIEFSLGITGDKPPSFVSAGLITNWHTAQ